MSTPYDAFAPLYPAWTASAPVAGVNRDFYVERYLRTEGPVVELGVGDGRIALEAARRGRALVGVDSSAGMLERCRAAAEREGLAALLELRRADFRDFELDRPAALVALPFHSIGHLLEPAERLACMRHVRSRLAPGGRFVFDHFVYSHDYQLQHEGRALLRAEFVDETDARHLVWLTTRSDPAERKLTLDVCDEVLDGDGRSLARRFHQLLLAWIDPAETRAQLLEVGFELEAVYGDFAGAPFTPDARHQVYVARRPG